MTECFHPPGRRSGAVFLAAAVLAVAGASVARAGGDRAPKRDKLAFLDSRQSPANQKILKARAAKLSTEVPAATASLKDSLGVEGVVKLDPLTGTASFVGRTDGFLTGPSSAPAAGIGLSYVSANAAALGLSPDGLAALKLNRDYVDIIGTHHLSYVQQVNGVNVFGNGVRVNVAMDGRIINVTGSPVSSLAGAPAVTPGINGTQAIVSARRDVGFAPTPVPETRDEDGITLKTGDNAKLVYFKTLDGLRLAWQTIVSDGDMYQSVVDATSGEVLWRQTLTRAATGKVWDYRPGAPHGGTQHDVDLLQWGGNFSPTTLFSNNSLAYSDVNASNSRQASESVLPGAYLFAPFSSTLNSPCSPAYPCSWDSDYFTGQNSWQVNRRQNAVQAFFFVNNFHDHLLAAPIGFTEAAGNFQLNNPTGEGFGGDPVVTETDDGANTLIVNGTLAGLPDPNHSDNANMGTPPDGFAPRMQMFLFNDPTTMIFHNYIDPTVPPDPFVQSNGGDDASVVYHEYTHGLSNRLVVDADGNSTLGNIQAGSMGEAWSDWYALDYLEKTGNVVDAPGVADVLEGEYVSGGRDLIRTEPIDCKVGTSNGDPACNGDPDGTAGTGGYTYGDFGKIIGRPEVHADGEIWGQTLWDLRDAVGSDNAEMLATRAMELSPGNPSFLDMRNSILAADLVAFGGANHGTIWEVFARRGMGYFAAAADGDDTRPVEDFQTPPTNSKFGKLLGKVSAVETGQPIEGAVIAFGGHSSGFADDIIGVTKENGLYDIKKILVGTYPKVRVSAPGFDPVTEEFVIVDQHANHLDVALRRNWASLLGGGSIVDFSGPDYTPFGCGPTGAIDDSLGSGWGSDTDEGASTGLVKPKFIVARLPYPINVSEIKVDPSNTCGDPGSSSTRGYKIETSADGVTFAEVSRGVFYAANRNQLNTVALAGPLSGVQYIRFWILTPQVPNAASGACTSAATCGTDPEDQSNVAAHCGPGKDNGFGGCTFMDMVELKVYGRQP